MMYDMVKLKAWLKENRPSEPHTDYEEMVVASLVDQILEKMEQISGKE